MKEEILTVEKLLKCRKIKLKVKENDELVTVNDVINLVMKREGKNRELKVSV